jgi:hypothetical protein
MSVLKVFQIKTPNKEPNPEKVARLKDLVKEYLDPALVKAQHDAASEKKFEKQERHRNVEYKQLLRDIYERAIKIADFFDHERSNRKKGAKLPPCPHLKSPITGIDTKHYRQCAIWALVMSCNPPIRGEWPHVMIHDRIPEGIQAKAWYKDGAITYNERLKDSKGEKPNPVFFIKEIQPIVDAYIATLPTDQCYMVVNKLGKPYKIETFTSAIHKWTAAVHGENFGINFLRTKNVEDNAGFVRGCIDTEFRGHTPAMALSHYATEPFKKRIQEQMTTEKENDVIGSS